MIERFNLAQQPVAFAENALVEEFLERSGAGPASGVARWRSGARRSLPEPGRTRALAGAQRSVWCRGSPFLWWKFLPRGGAVKFLAKPPRYLFFTGKGVGKTSIACAAAIHLADAGRRVLLVSTGGFERRSGLRPCDRQPASSRSRPCRGFVRWRSILQAAAQAYRDRIVGPVRGVLPEAVVRGIEQLSGACTTEIAAFDEFTALLIDSAGRLLSITSFSTPRRPGDSPAAQLPGAWSGFLESGSNASCLDVAGLEKRTQYKAAVSWPILGARAWSWSRGPRRRRCGKWPAPTRSSPG